MKEVLLAKYLELHGPTAVAWEIQEVEAQAASVAVQEAAA